MQSSRPPVNRWTPSGQTSRLEAALSAGRELWKRSQTPTRAGTDAAAFAATTNANGPPPMPPDDAKPPEQAQSDLVDVDGLILKERELLARVREVAQQITRRVAQVLADTASHKA